MRLSWLLFLDVGQAGDSKFQQSAIHWVVPNASHLFVGIRSLWLMFRAPVSLFYHRKEAGVRTAKIVNVSGKWLISTFLLHVPSLLCSAPTLPLPLELDRADLAPSPHRSFLFHYILPHFTSLAGFASSEGGAVGKRELEHMMSS